MNRAKSLRDLHAHRSARTGCVIVEGGERTIAVYIGERRIDHVSCVEETAPALAEVMARVLARSGAVDRCEVRHRMNESVGPNAEGLRRWNDPPKRVAIFGRTAAEDDFTVEA